MSDPTTCSGNVQPLLSPSLGTGHVRQATHRATGRKVAVKILPALDFDQVITKDILLDAIEAQKEVILLKVMGAFGIKGVVGLDMVKQEGDWK